VYEYSKNEQKNAVKAEKALKKEIADKKELEQWLLEMELEMAAMRVSLFKIRKVSPLRKEFHTRMNVS
jgi:hypothetical protein